MIHQATEPIGVWDDLREDEIHPCAANVSNPTEIPLIPTCSVATIAFAYHTS